jgi:hypothetical protein
MRCIWCAIEKNSEQPIWFTIGCSTSFPVFGCTVSFSAFPIPANQKARPINCSSRPEARGDLAQMVERSLSMREALGSMPRFSIFCAVLQMVDLQRSFGRMIPISKTSCSVSKHYKKLLRFLWTTDSVSESLRMWTRNPLGFAPLVLFFLVWRRVGNTRNSMAWGGPEERAFTWTQALTAQLVRAYG